MPRGVAHAPSMEIRSADVEGEAVVCGSAVGGSYANHFFPAAIGLLPVECVALVVDLILQGVSFEKSQVGKR